MDIGGESCRGKRAHREQGTVQSHEHLGTSRVSERGSLGSLKKRVNMGLG